PHIDVMCILLALGLQYDADLVDEGGFREGFGLVRRLARILDRHGHSPNLPRRDLGNRHSREGSASGLTIPGSTRRLHGCTALTSVVAECGTFVAPHCSRSEGQ